MERAGCGRSIFWLVGCSSSACRSIFETESLIHHRWRRHNDVDEAGVQGSGPDDGSYGLRCATVRCFWAGLGSSPASSLPVHIVLLGTAAGGGSLSGTAGAAASALLVRI